MAALDQTSTPGIVPRLLKLPSVPFLPGVAGIGYGVAFLAFSELLGSKVISRYPMLSVPSLPGLGPLMLVTDPTLVKQVFTADPAVLLGGAGVGPAEVIYGSNSMFVQEEPVHMRRRRLLTPPLHGDVLAAYVPIIERATLAGMAQWPTDRPFPMLAASRAMTLDVIVRVIFGVDDPGEVERIGQPFHALLEFGVSEETTLRYVLRRFGTLRSWRRKKRADEKLADVVLPLIATRRRDPNIAERSDVLSLMLQARDENGDGLTNAEIRDDLVTLMLAGHETTATTLSWIFDALLHQPGALRRVITEAHSGDTAYTHAVINETLRLHPPVPFTSRVASRPYELGGRIVPAGTRIVPYIDAVNRNPDIYPNPMEFQPDRFLHSRPNMFAWIPFGGGMKRCIGAQFSMTELTAVLHTLLRNGEFNAVSPRPEKPVRNSVVTVPKHGAQVRFRPITEMAKAQGVCQ